MSAPDAAEAAALARAGLARGFALIEGRSGADMPSAAENERILTHLAREALAEAEALRAMRRPRDDAASLAAEAAHAAEAQACRDALRRTPSTRSRRRSRRRRRRSERPSTGGRPVRS